MKVYTADVLLHGRYFGPVMMLRQMEILDIGWLELADGVLGYI